MARTVKIGKSTFIVRFEKDLTRPSAFGDELHYSRLVFLKGGQGTDYHLTQDKRGGWELSRVRDSRVLHRGAPGAPFPVE